MSEHAALVREKLDQAVAILNEQQVDAWMTFVQETALAPDPSLDLILNADVVWLSAFILTRDNRRIAIVGYHDAEMVRSIGGYTEVIPYVEGIRSDLVRVLQEINPRQIALNYSESDMAADGLGHGLMLLLQRTLNGTDLIERFVSAERIVSALRGRKSPTEVERIKVAIATTQRIFQQVGRFAKPGMSEVEIADFVHSYLTRHGLGTAWDWQYCPIVSCGPDSPVGHSRPQPQYTIRPGALLHMDFGVKENDYCADLQRVWYVRRSKSDPLPEPVSRAWAAAHRALIAGFDALRPGMQGWQVDEVARCTLVESGYPEYPHAFGHHVGRRGHDGATILGPRWERYGDTPYGVVEAGNVFAIELGVEVEAYGYIGLEENVVVTDNGAQWLSDPQTDPWLL